MLKHFTPIAIITIMLLSQLMVPQSASYAAGNSLYVAPGGSDDASGSLSSPFRTINYAVNQANSGDTIQLRAGIYNESIQFTRSGSNGYPIHLTNYSTEAVTIHGGSNPAIIDITGTQYWIVEGLKLDSNNQYTILFDAWACDGTCGGTHNWVFRDNTVIGAAKLYGSYHLFENNEFDGSQHKGSEDAILEFNDVSHHNIYRNNYIHDYASRGIWSMHRTHDSIFEGNTIGDIGDNTEGMCVDTDGFGTVVWRHTIRNNVLYRCGEAGIEMENTFDSLVENNIIYDSGRRAIDVINYGPEIESPGADKCEVGGENNQYGDTNGDNNCEGDLTGNIIRQNLIYGGGRHGAIVIYHAGGISIWGNTIANTAGAGLVLDSGAQNTPQIDLRGNIFYQNDDIAISLVDAASLSQDSNNILYNTNGYIYELRSTGAFLNLAQYQSQFSKGSASLQTDPQFINASGRDYHLNSNSPAIDLGINIGLSQDLDGNARPQGNGFDAGPYESNSSAPQPSPTPTASPSPTPTSTPAPGQPTFDDVSASHPYYAYIESLYQAGFTSGCSSDPMLFCPETPMIRAESSVFIVRGIHGANFTPPAVSQPNFIDVQEGGWSEKWITQLYLDGYTAGCETEPMRFCPEQTHLRAEGAVFYLRMLHGANYTPPPATGIFQDVDVNTWYAPWLEAAYNANLIEPCSTSPNLQICPEDVLTRSVAAYMMVQAKGLPLPE